MTDIATTEPYEITAGDYLQWKRSFDDYPASDGWQLTYALVSNSKQITITASASGDDHLVTLAASTTANYTPGKYHWQAYITKSTERYTVDSGSLEILPNFAAQSTGYDARSNAQKIYEACEALILKKATHGQSEMLVGGEVLGSYPLPRLLELRDRYKAIWELEKRAERISNGLGHEGNIYVRFTNG